MGSAPCGCGLPGKFASRIIYCKEHRRVAVSSARRCAAEADDLKHSQPQDKMRQLEPVPFLDPILWIPRSAILPRKRANLATTLGVSPLCCMWSVACLGVTGRTGLAYMYIDDSSAPGRGVLQWCLGRIGWERVLECPCSVIHSAILQTLAGLGVLGFSAEQRDDEFVWRLPGALSGWRLGGGIFLVEPGSRLTHWLQA